MKKPHMGFFSFIVSDYICIVEKKWKKKKVFTNKQRNSNLKANNVN